MLRIATSAEPSEYCAFTPKVKGFPGVIGELKGPVKPTTESIFAESPFCARPVLRTRMPATASIPKVINFLFVMGFSFSLNLGSIGIFVRQQQKGFRSWRLTKQLELGRWRSGTRAGGPARTSYHLARLPPLITRSPDYWLR
jgi:hypothetical protein